jgi:dolichol-phosphate mannosyltransferase
VNLGLFVLLTSVAGLHYLEANLIAIAAASVINFGISASWTWRSKRPLASASVPVARWEPESSSRRIVVIPTYNESANIRRLLERILSLGQEYEALVVDDSSPDGTGEFVEAMAASEPRIHMIRRRGKMGLASAYISGFRVALGMGADLIYQMDSDFSHDPDDLRRLGEAVTPGSVVIGSRYVAGGSTPGWPLPRILFSRIVNQAARILLGIPIHDVSGGFKCWSRRALASLPLDSIRSAGFAFQVEMNYLAWRTGFCLVEVPIAFKDRKAGRSKASLGIGIEMAAVVCRLFLSSSWPTPAPRPSMSKES